MQPAISPSLRSFIDQTIDAAQSRSFAMDPILGPSLSRVHSQLGSLVKRDGNVLQRALFEALATSPFLTVWSENAFPVTAEADRLADQRSYASCLATNLPLSRNVCRRVRVDIVVLDHRSGIVTAYEIKRGNGALDAGKRRQTILDTLRIGMLAKAYTQGRGFRVRDGGARVVFIHGRTTLPSDISLTGNELDEHFDLPIQEQVEAATDYFRQRVADIVAPRLMVT